MSSSKIIGSKVYSPAMLVRAFEYFNRAFFKKFDTDPDKPWLVQESNMYLLYDYVHLMKCIRNKAY